MAAPFCCAGHLLAQLPDADNISADNECGICQEKYAQPGDRHGERAVRLPCGHVIGYTCISKWLVEQRQTTCHYRCVLISDRSYQDYDDPPTPNMPGLVEVDNISDDIEDNMDYVHDGDDFLGPEFYHDHTEDLDEYSMILDVIEASMRAHENGCISRARRERQTYRRLLAVGANLPALTPGHVNELPSTEIDALYTEIQLRGALNVRTLLDVRTSGEVSDREMFDIFRSKGYVWSPRVSRTRQPTRPSGWSLGNGRFLLSVDSEEHRDEVFDAGR